jgi:hypothetical protein
MKLICDQCGASPGNCVHYGLHGYDYRTVLEPRDRVFRALFWLALIIASVSLGLLAAVLFRGSL